MYQVVINDKYYVEDIVGKTIECVSTFDIKQAYCNIEELILTANKCSGKLFLDKEEAELISEQIGGKVIEYIKKRYI